jgi:hypothetical protein
MMEKLTAISIPNGYARDEISEISDFALRPLGGPLSSPTGWVFAQRCGFGAFGFMARPLDVRSIWAIERWGHTGRRSETDRPRRERRQRGG